MPLVVSLHHHIKPRVGVPFISAKNLHTATIQKGLYLFCERVVVDIIPVKNREVSLYLVLRDTQARHSLCAPEMSVFHKLRLWVNRTNRRFQLREEIPPHDDYLFGI